MWRRFRRKTFAPRRPAIFPEQWGIVEAYYFRRQSIDAIAAETQRSVESIYKTLQRVRLLLRQCIEQAEQTGESFA